MLAYQSPRIANRPETGKVEMRMIDLSDRDAWTDPAGWLWIPGHGQTIGSAASGAVHARNDLWQLFEYLWNIPAISVAGGKGASAAVDWSNDRLLVLPDARGRSICAAGAGPGLTARSVAALFGKQSEFILASHLPPSHLMSGNVSSQSDHIHATTTSNDTHTHTGSTSSDTHSHNASSSSDAHNHSTYATVFSNTTAGGSGARLVSNDTPSTPGTNDAGLTSSDSHSHTITVANDTHGHTLNVGNNTHNHLVGVSSAGGHNHSYSINLGGGGSALELLQPSIALHLLLSAGVPA